ncbi:hypothetical protein SDC9_169242 [bioreactor metagenome]|uniref:Uncharacterized protein n=1 Tax=bioreactor metagenome TaxID=1076179 RepID=A0A645G7A3_9ZZZZ
MQIDIVKTGAAVQDAIINDKAFKVQHAEGFAGIDRHTVYRHIDTRIFMRHSAIPVGVGIGCCRANTSTLRTMPVDEYPNIQLRTLPFRLVKRAKNAFATVILFQIQGNNANALLRAGYLFQWGLPEPGGSIKEIDIIN